MVTPDQPTRSVIDSSANPTATGVPHSTAVAGPLVTTERYLLGDEIARGGMGVVLRATDTVLGREIAVKVLQEKYSTNSGIALRFADEARITSQLQHPSIPPVHDLGTLPDGRPFLAMKLIKGLTLEALLQRRTDPGDGRGRLVAAFEQVCQALAYAHSHDVIHRDLKPANVMVGSYGEVQVMDWGLAKVLGPGNASGDPEATVSATRVDSQRDSDRMYTQAGSVMGTPAFMPPEQAIGAIGEIDARSDVFGLGAILAVILTGKPPFVADSAEAARVMAARGDIGDCYARLDACGADPDLVALCKRCLAPKPAERPVDAGAVAKAVAELRAAAEERARRAELDRVRVEGEKATAEAKAAERRKRRTLGIGAVVVLALAVVGGLTAVLLVQRKANADLEAKKNELIDEQAKVENRFELAQKAIATFHTGISEEMLLKNDQFKELRTKLLKQAAEFYADLEKLLEGQTDIRSRKALAGGYFQLGVLTAKIGSTSEALAVHRKSLALRRELAALPGADWETRLDVARSLDAVGTCLYDMGDMEEALRLFAEQHDVAAAMEVGSPTEAVQVILAQSFAHSGRLLPLMQKSSEGLVATEKALAIRRKLVKANPADTERQYDLAENLIIASPVLWTMGRWPEALSALDEAQIIMEKLDDANHSVTRYRVKLVRAHTFLSDLSFDEGMLAKALMSAKKACAIVLKIANTQPADTDIQLYLAFNHSMIGKSLCELGETDEAMAAYQKALDICRKVLEDDPTNIWFQVNLASSYNGIGEVYTRMGKPVEALKSHEQARELLGKPADSAQMGIHLELARSLSKIGLLLSASVMPDKEKALMACQKVVTLQKKRNDIQPGLNNLQEDLAGGISVLGTVQGRLGQPKEAVVSLRHAVGLVEKLPTLSPRNYYNLACCHAQLAGLAADSGSGLTSEQGKAEAEQAMTDLRQAFATGYDSVANLRTATSLDTLRPREDFRKLLEEQEALAKERKAKADPKDKQDD